MAEVNEPGLALVVNGLPRRLRALRLHAPGRGALQVWTADVDGFPGCAGTLEAAILMAARAAEAPNGKPGEKETGGEG